MLQGRNSIIWTPGTSLSDVERQAIECAMHFYRGVKASVARSLGISARTLDTRLSDYRRDDAERRRKEHDEFEKRKQFLASQKGETYTMVPYVDPEEIPETPTPNGDTKSAVVDAPPVIPPPAPTLSGKVVVGGRNGR